MSEQQTVEAVTHALEQVFREQGVLLGKHIVIAEVYEPGGDRPIWMCAPEDQPMWDSLGLIRYADHAHAADLANE